MNRQLSLFQASTPLHQASPPPGQLCSHSLPVGTGQLSPRTLPVSHYIGAPLVSFAGHLFTGGHLSVMGSPGSSPGLLTVPQFLPMSVVTNSSQAFNAIPELRHNKQGALLTPEQAPDEILDLSTKKADTSNMQPKSDIVTKPVEQVEPIDFSKKAPAQTLLSGSSSVECEAGRGQELLSQVSPSERESIKEAASALMGMSLTISTPPQTPGENTNSTGENSVVER